MIELRNVNKRFGDRYVLKNINFKFPKHGIVSIFGPSGCGKTTLLNVISSLCDFEGEIIFNCKKYSRLSEKDKDDLRNSKIGFVFQDYKLFEQETVKTNLLLSLDIKSKDKTASKVRKIGDLLKIIGLYEKENEVVSKLSGGEKQRISIVRAILNSPKVVLADEPTGNLDEKSSVEVMELLLKVAQKSLVILVSHDQALVNKYSDEIIFLKDGEVTEIKYMEHNEHNEPLPLVHIKPNDKRARLPISFCFKHAFRGISKRKWRTLFILFTTSLGLFGVGLGTMLSDTISTNLYKNYSTIIDTNKVIMENKNPSGIDSKITAIEREEVFDLYKLYKNDIKDIGVYYWNNFETMFTSYSFSLSTDGVMKKLPSLTLTNFNQFVMLEDALEPLPEKVDELDINEVVISFDYLTVSEICYQLRIPKTVKALSEYLTQNELEIIVNIQNSNWEYDVTFPLKLKAFILAKQTAFYHSNRYWNEIIFENYCHLPYSTSINGMGKYPWELKKSYYYEFLDNRDHFLEDIRFARKYQYMVGEILDDKYYQEGLFKESNRVCLLNKNNKDQISGYLSPYIKSVSSDISSLTFGCKYSYAIYPSSLMMGFARETYISIDEEKVNEIIDLTSYLKYEESMNVTVPDDIIEGHFSKPAASSLTFSASYNLVYGKHPEDYSQIVISQGVVNKLKIDRPLGTKLHFAYPIKEEILPNGYLSRKYKDVELNIVGISDSDNFELSHHENWTIMFFQTMLGLSSFDLSIDSIALSVNENMEDAVIKTLERSFPEYKATSPIQNVKESVENVCKYIKIILLILSVSSVIIASILLSLCNHLHFMEIKKDIGLVRCLGIDKNEASKIIYCHSILMVFLSMIFAICELFITSLVLSKTFSDMLAIDSKIIFNPMSVIYMLLIAAGITFVSSLFIKRRVSKLEPLECLR